jgi:phosphate-selective porin OprO/OprP
MKLTKKFNRLAAALFASQILTTAALADQTTDQIEALKKQIQELSLKVDELEQQHATNSAKQSSAPFITAGAEGFSLQSADTNFILNLRGFAQVDARDYLRSAPGRDTFTIRRMRAIASGSVFHDYEYYLQPDFASGVSSTTTNDAFLQDAYVNFHHWDALQIQAGKFKEPVSMEVLPLDQYLWFLERGFPTELAPNRDVGVDVHGNLWNGALTYAAGVFNGVPDGGSGDVEVADNDKDAVMRVIAAPFKNTSVTPLQNFAFGLGSSYGLQPGTATPTFATVARQTFFAYSNTVSGAGQHLRLDPQGSYYWGPLCLYWEYAISDEKFRLASGKTPHSAYFENSGWDVVGSWYLTGESNVFGMLPEVERPFRIGSPGWGAWQLAARFGQISLDHSAFPLYASSGSAQGATSWSLALNWYLNHNVKCIFEYDQTAFTGGSRARGAVTANDEMAIQGRLQFGF